MNYSSSSLLVIIIIIIQTAFSAYIFDAKLSPSFGNSIYSQAPVDYTIWTNDENCWEVSVFVVRASNISDMVASFGGVCNMNSTIASGSTTLTFYQALLPLEVLVVSLTGGTVSGAYVDYWLSSSNFTIHASPFYIDVAPDTLNIAWGSSTDLFWSTLGQKDCVSIYFFCYQNQLTYRIASNITDTGVYTFTWDFGPQDASGHIIVLWCYGSAQNTSQILTIFGPLISPSISPSNAPHNRPPGPNQGKDNSSLYIAIGGVIVGVLLVGGVAIFCLVKRSRNKKRQDRMDNIKLAVKPEASQTNSETQQPRTQFTTSAHYEAIAANDHYNDMHPESNNHNNTVSPQETQKENQQFLPPSTTPHIPSSKHTSMVPTAVQWEIDFGEITLQKEIGTGAYGRVYAGLWRQSKVAVKVLKTQFLSDKDIREFQSEADVMMRLRPHRNVVQLLGICTKPPNFCMVMEFMDAGSLASHIKKTAMSESEMIEIARGIAAGMYHLACEKIVHRDLAARNILMDNGGVPKVSDFGMSRVLQTEDEGQTQSFIGPIKWMSPESIGSREYSEKSDVWSYGIVLWEITHRSPPHPNLQLIDAAVMIRSGGAPEVGPNTPNILKMVMELCWKLNPVDRPTFSEVCKYLCE